MFAPLLFVPGTFCNYRLFAPQQAFMSSMGIETLVASINEGDSIELMAANILEKAPKRFALAGLSMGGIIAFELFRQAPERLTHLALLDTNFLPETKEKAVARDQKRVEISAAQSCADAYLAFVKDTLFPNYTAAKGDELKALQETVVKMADETSWEVGQRQLLALNSRPDSTQTLQEINLPTAVICGKEDKLCPVERHQRMHALIPDATLDILPDCGHLCTLEKPKQVSELLYRWLHR